MESFYGSSIDERSPHEYAAAEAMTQKKFS
jgi:hypothetical protein